MKYLLLVLIPLSLAGCQSSSRLSDKWQALPVQQHFEVDYQGGILAGNGPAELPLAADLDFYAGISTSSAAGPLKEQETGGVDPARVWTIHPHIVKLSLAAARRWLPGALDGLAGYLPRAEFESSLAAMVQTGDARIFSGSKMTAYEQSRVRLTVLSQQAFIHSFGLERNSKVLIADPKVEVFNGGIVLDITPSSLTGIVQSEAAGAKTAEADPGEVKLDFSFDLNELLAMQEVHSSFPSFGSALTMQVPVFVTQSLRGSFALQANQTVHLPAIHTADDQVLLIFLDAQYSGSHPIPAELIELVKELQGQTLESVD
jgi:hypothetical protein